MKKTTLKILTFILITMFGFQVQGQIAPLDADGYGFFNAADAEGTWKIKLKNQVGGETLFLTVNNDLEAVWLAEIANDDPSQLWIIKNHADFAQGAESYYVETAVSVISGKVLKADINSASSTSDVTPNLIIGDPTEQDKWQMRKFANVEPDYSSNGQLPGQNALLLLQ